MVVLGISICILLFKEGDAQINSLRNKKIALAGLGLYAVMLISNIFSDNPAVTLFGTLDRGMGFYIQILCLAFATLIALFLKPKSINMLLKAIIFAGVVNSIYAVLQFFGIELFFQNYGLDLFEGRSFGLYGNPSMYGQAISLLIPIAIYFATQAKKPTEKTLWVFFTLLFLAGIGISQTRTGLLGLIVGAGLFILKYGVSKLNKKTIISALAIIIAVPICFSTLFPDRFSFTEAATRSLESRLEIWKGVLKLSGESLVFGHGTGTLYINFPNVINKDILALEEDAGVNVDKAHNESLEVLYSYGLLGVGFYLTILILLALRFFKSKDKRETMILLVLLMYHIQNQLSFPDISLLVTIHALYGMVLIGEKNKTIQVSKYASVCSTIIILLFSYIFIYKPLMAEANYTKSKNSNGDFVTTVNGLKSALYYAPYYTELWYELMMIDPSSSERSLHYLKQLEGDSGTVNAWQGNFYAKTDPAKSSEFYLKALEKNPYNPNWIKAYADMLYFNGDYENAIFLYDKFLDSVPDIWSTDENASEYDKKRARIFLKNSQIVKDVFARLKEMESKFSGK